METLQQRLIATLSRMDDEKDELGRSISVTKRRDRRDSPPAPRRRSRSRSRSRSRDRRRDSPRDRDRRRPSRDFDKGRRSPSPRRSRPLVDNSADYRRNSSGRGNTYNNNYSSSRYGPSFRGPPIVTGIEPMKTYKQFLLTCDDMIEPDVAKEKYAAHKKEYLSRFSQLLFAQHKNEEWFQKRYNPLLKEATDVLAKEKKAKAFEAFEREAVGRNLILSRDAIPASGEVLVSGAAAGDAPAYLNSLTLAQCHRRDDRFDVDHAVYLFPIPPTCSHEEMLNAIAKAGVIDLVDVLFSHPTKTPPSGLHYSAYLAFKNKEDADNARDKLLKSSRVKDGEDGSFTWKVQRFLAKAPVYLSSDFAKPDRIQQDLQQAAQLGDSLHLESELEGGGPSSLLRQAAVKSLKAEEKLDVCIQYLRYVHHFEYYMGQQFLDRGDLWLSCPLPPLRPQTVEISVGGEESAAADVIMSDPSSSKKDDPTGTDAYNNSTKIDVKVSKSSPQWALKLDSLINARIAAAKAASNGSEASEKTIVAERLIRARSVTEKTQDTFLKEYTFREAEDPPVFRCNFQDCKKRFRAVEFVHKHIQSKHQTELLKAEASDLAPLVEESYFADSDRFLPSLEEITSTTIYGAQSDAYSGGSGPRTSFGAPAASSGSRGDSGGYRPSSYAPRGGDDSLRADRPYAPAPYRRGDPPPGVSLDPRALSAVPKVYVDADAPTVADVDLDYGDF